MKGLRVTPLINGVEYSWSSIAFIVLGAPIYGVTAINYDENQTIENIPGASTMPVARGYGSFENTASITLHSGEVENIMRAARAKGYSRIQDIPMFNIVVSYMPNDVNKAVKHTLRNVEFKQNPRNVSEGDTSIGVEIELAISHIDWE